MMPPSPPPGMPLDYEAAPRVSRGAGVAMLIVASVLWSLSGVALKVTGMSALGFAFYRSLAAALVMLPLLPLGRGNRPHLGWGLLGALLYTVVVALLVTSMKESTAAAGILLQYTAPVFCALFAAMFCGRAVDRRTGLALAIATAGVAIMVVGGWTPGGWAGPVAGLISGAAFGGLILVLEKSDRAAGGVDPFLIVMINNLGAALILLPLCWATGTLAVAPWQLAVVGATGAVQLAAPYVLFQLALRRVRPVDASLLILLEPVLNPVWVALATSERPDGATLIGGAAILIALVIEATKPSRETKR